MAGSDLANKALEATTHALGLSLSPEDHQQALSTLAKTGDNTLETYVQKIGELRAEKRGGALNLGELKNIAIDSATSNAWENKEYAGNEQNHPFAVLGQRFNILYKAQHPDQSTVAENFPSSPGRSGSTIQKADPASPLFDVEGFEKDLSNALKAAQPELQAMTDAGRDGRLSLRDLKDHGAKALNAATPALAAAVGKLNGGVLENLAKDPSGAVSLAGNLFKRMSSNHP